MQCPWSWWNLHYLFLSLLSAGVQIGFGHCKEGSSLICIKTCSIGIIRGVKLVNFGLLSWSSFFFPVIYLTLRVSFFLSRLLLVSSSLFLFTFISFASTESFAFKYFWAFWSNFVTVFGGLFMIEKKKSSSSNPAWKAVRMTWSSASSTCSSSLLNQVTYCLSDSPSACWMLRKWPVVFLCICPPIKWRTKPLPCCSNFAIVLGCILLNYTLATPFSVIRNALHITSSVVICNNINVLNDSMWSKGSLEPSYDSSYGRRNFGGRRQFSTSMVNGKSDLQIIPSKFSPPFSFMALFNLSISFLMLRSSFSILEESSPEVLSRLLAWEFDSSSF